MDYDVQDGLFLVTLLCSILFLWRSLSKSRRKLPLPPGPKGLPIIGNMQLIDQLTHRGLADLCKQYGGLVHLRLGVLHNVAIATPAAAREVLQLRDHVFSNRPATIAVQFLTYNRADMAFAHYGQFWRQMRKLCVMKLFSRRRSESWAAVRDEVDTLVRAVAADAGAEVNIGELVFNLTRNVIYRAAFGSRSHEGQDEFVKILQEFSKLMGAFNVVDFMPACLRWIDPQGFNKRLHKARGSLDRFIDHIIDDHMAAARGGRKPEDECDMVDDLISFVGEQTVDGKDDDTGLRLHRDNIKAIIMVSHSRLIFVIKTELCASNNYKLVYHVLMTIRCVYSLVSV